MLNDPLAQRRGSRGEKCSYSQHHHRLDDLRIWQWWTWLINPFEQKDFFSIFTGFEMKCTRYATSSGLYHIILYIPLFTKYRGGPEVRPLKLA